MEKLTNMFDKIASKRAKITGMATKAGKAATEYNKQMALMRNEITGAQVENAKEIKKLTDFGKDLKKLEEGVNMIVPVSVVDNFIKK